MIAAFVAMELCWLGLAVGIAWVWMGGGAWPPPLPILGAMPLGVISAKCTPYVWRWRRWFDGYRLCLALSTSLLAATVSTLLADLSPFASGWFVALFASLVLFTRGWSIGEDTLDAQSVEVAFQLGAAATLILVVALQWLVPDAGVLWATGFFFAGLFALGLARRGERRRQTVRADADWWALAIGLAVAVLVVASLIVGLISPDVLRALGDQVGGALGFVASAVSSLLAMLGALPGLFGPGVAPSQIPPTGPPDLGPPEPPPFSFDLPLLLRYRLQQLAEALALLALAYIAYRLVAMIVRGVRRRRREPRPPRRPAPKSESPPFSLGRWWSRLIAAIIAWFRPSRLGDPVTTPQAPRSALSREQRSIRELYRDFLRSCDRQGLRRAKSQTPSELAALLAARRPTSQHVVDELTRLYIGVRYAERPVSRQELTRMREAVGRASRMLALDDRSDRDGRPSSGRHTSDESAPRSAE